MAGIIEIWRKVPHDALPVRFMVGERPYTADGEEVVSAPIVRDIDYRETGAIAGKRLVGPVFCIMFEDTFVQRFIPADSVVDIAYETKKADIAKAPALEG